MPLFEFVVEGPPVSLNAKEGSPHSRRRYREWMRKVNASAAAVWPAGDTPTSSDLIVVHVTNYFTVAPPDVDNIIKPICDALIGLVYGDDRQVYKVISEKADLNQQVSISNPSPLLAQALAVYDELVHIVVTWETEV